MVVPELAKRGAKVSGYVRGLVSAMTRTRATEDDVPTDVMRDYYVQRASAGLIVTECTQISTQAHGIIRAPGLTENWATPEGGTLVQYLLASSPMMSPVT
jgi:2,4-dienoyl-CoA reductase-like NADH-dependent reductase (Old Yellow Enzyme family)